MASSRSRHHQPWVTRPCPRELPEEVLSCPRFRPPTWETLPAKRVLWKWSAAATVLILVFLMWQWLRPVTGAKTCRCYPVRHFQEQLNAADYEGICREADQGIRKPRSRSNDQILGGSSSKARRRGNRNPAQHSGRDESRAAHSSQLEYSTMFGGWPTLAVFPTAGGRLLI